MFKTSKFLGAKGLVSDRLFGKGPNFVIVSTGRAGSTFLAKFLTELGIPCAHEGFFTPDGVKKRSHYVGDCSWLALPYLEQGTISDVRVIHHTRNPLDVVSSLYGIHFLDGNRDTRFKRFARRFFELGENEIENCVRWWVEWNTRCEKVSSLTFKIEDFEDCAEEFFLELGVEPVPHWEAVYKSLNQAKVNSRKRKEVTLEDIPEGKAKDDLRFLAEKYEYL